MANTSVTVGSSSTAVLNTTTSPMIIILTNDSNEDMYLAINDTAVMNSGILLQASGGALVLDTRGITISKLYAICTSGSKNLCISYL